MDRKALSSGLEFSDQAFGHHKGPAMLSTTQRHESVFASNVDPRLSVQGDFATSIPGLSLLRGQPLETQALGNVAS